jgi:Ca2+-binding RTX toxin-like protein
MSLPVSAIVLGGAGDDTLTSKVATSVLVGGIGNDTLDSRDDRSLLIGGRGRDTLRGSKGENILVAGSTTYGENLAALDQVLAKLSSQSRYDARVDNFLATFLNPGVTVFDDGEPDRMNGRAGRDWFLGDFRNSSANKDKVRIVRRLNERSNQLPMARPARFPASR